MIGVVFRETTRVLPAGDVPQPDHVLVPGSQRSPVRAEGHNIDVDVVLVEPLGLLAVSLLTRGNVPQAESALAGRTESFTAGAEEETPNPLPPGLVHRAEFRSCLHVPESDFPPSARRAAGRKEFSIWTE